VDVKPLITATYPIAQAVEAFEIAGDRSKMMKVQISFD
jgi:L-idonate 5-dehydrogenase